MAARVAFKGFCPMGKNEHAKQNDKREQFGCENFSFTFAFSALSYRPFFSLASPIHKSPTTQIFKIIFFLEQGKYYFSLVSTYSAKA